MLSLIRLISISVLAASITAAKAAEGDAPAIGSATDESGFPLKNTNAPAATAQPIFRFNGFGALGVSHSSQSLGDYVIDSTVPKGPGRSSDFSFGNDTKLGLQLTGDFTPHISAVLQLVSEYQPDSTYSPEVQWANAKYAFNSDAYIRVGRIALPTFLYSDSRKVGYSYPWIHLPADLYRQLSMTNSDGADAEYRFSLAEASNSVRIFAGTGFNELPASTTHSNDMRGIFDTLEFGATTFRVGYQARESSSQSTLSGAWIKTSDLTAGARYDPGDWFAVSEWIQRKSNTKLSAMYASFGLRIKKFTPYLTYSQNSPASFLTGFPAPSSTTIQSAQRSQSTASLGVRWDFMKQKDFKLQLDQVRLGDNSNGYLANVPTGVILYGTDFHVISAVFDFIF
jgi:hypothetical protein